MDLENKPNMKRLGLLMDRQMYMWTRIGGGQADVYGSGKEYVGGGGIW